MACCSAPSENKDRDLMPILTDKNDKAICRDAILTNGTYFEKHLAR
jgi:hypothetical protein